MCVLKESLMRLFFLYIDVVGMQLFYQRITFLQLSSALFLSQTYSNGIAFRTYPGKPTYLTHSIDPHNTRVCLLIKLLRKL